MKTKVFEVSTIFDSIETTLQDKVNKWLEAFRGTDIEIKHVVQSECQCGGTCKSVTLTIFYKI